MKTIKQMLRQPVKTLFGVILMALATAILCIAIGQSISARATISGLENSFTTLGVPEGTVSYKGYTMFIDTTPPAEFSSWLEETAQNHPDIIKKLAKHGVLSAYIPELTPLNYTKGVSYSTSYIVPEDYSNSSHLEANPEGMPYTTAMLTFMLEEIGEPQEINRTYKLGKEMTVEDFPTPEDYAAYQNSRETVSVSCGYTVKISGTVTGVVSLQEGYRDPTGMTLRVTLTVATPDELELLNLEPGGEYIAFGLDYLDADWVLRSTLASNEEKAIEIDYFDPERMKVLEGSDLEFWKRNSPNNVPYALYDGWVKLSREQYEMTNSVSMTMGYQTLFTNVIIDEEGNFVGYEEGENRIYASLEGEMVQISPKEYATKYRMPTFARLDTGIEEFLKSEEGAVWQETLQWSEVNHQAFLVLGVDRLDYVTDFARQKSRVVEGRDFTGEELAAGARVCIMHETLAAANGLSIGDTVTLSFYQVDVCLPRFESQVYKTNLSAYFYVPTTPFTETAEYTIVGFWRGERLWCDESENAYALMPNTVIVPKSSVQTEMGYPTSKPFNTLVLHNGKAAEYRALAAEMGYENAYIFDDQGYSEISQSFHNYDELADKVLLVGAALYGVLLLLFLLLFPASRRKAVQTMESLGVSYGKRFADVVSYSTAILIPAAVLGGIFGAAAWHTVVSALAQSAESTITLELQPQLIVVITLAACVLALILNILVAIPVAMSFGKSKKR